MEAKETKERDLTKVWSDALGHERDKRDRSLGIQAAQFAHDLNIAERKIEREWKTISQTLQRQVGLAQKRTADIQLDWERGQRTYTDSVLQFERQNWHENMPPIKISAMIVRFSRLSLFYVLLPFSYLYLVHCQGFNG